MNHETADALRRVRLAARANERAERRFREAVQRAAGVTSQRAIAAACGMSLTSVNRIVNGGDR